jgi:adenosine 3'-phospho 5'-phosphosulfate transporter B2
MSHKSEYESVPTDEVEIGKENALEIEVPKALKVEDNMYVKFFRLLCCIVALQSSYLLWGIMQELIMNTKYNPTPNNPTGMFPSATFCVFSNRFLALIVSACLCIYNSGSVYSSASLLAFTPCALSNTISSWSQYQALSFVSFSLQTLFKSMKVIPVMFMGKVLKGKVYSYEEYIEAISITLGVIIFSYTTESDNNSSQTKTVLIGFILLCLYVIFDSFTSQYQSKLYDEHPAVSSHHMMFGVNASAIIITVFGLVISGEIFKVIEFFYYNPSSFWYNVLTAITSTTGQIAIMYTIKHFGAVAFTIIMTSRQMFSIVLSNIIFGHVMSLQSYIGCGIVFGTIFYSIRRQIKSNMKKSLI